jgi:hypothetical protein
MNRQEVGHRALVLGAGVLLIGSLGVGSASATSYTDNYNCVEVSYHHPRPSTDNSTGSSTDGSTDTPTDLDALTDALDTLTDALTDVLDSVPTTDLPTTDLPTTDLPTTDLPTTDLPTTDLPTTDLPLTDLGGGDSGTSETDTAGSAGDTGTGEAQNLRAEEPTTDSGTATDTPAETDADLDESGATLTTTDEGDNYHSGYSSSGYHSRVTCYVDNSVGHYYYRHRPVGEVYATQVRSVPVGGVATGN